MLMFRCPLGLLFALALLIAACDGNGGSPAGPTATPTIAPASAESICGATHRVAGRVASPELIEISGIAASRRNEGVLWAHNDSGDTPRVFAIGERGEHLAVYALGGAEALDWEAMAIGPGPEDGADYLYLGDIGDNDRVRTGIVVYRVAEPTVDRGGVPTAQELSGVERLALRYPDGPHDAETLMADPSTGDLLILTKDAANATLFRAAASSLQPGGTITLEEAARIDFTQLTVRREIPPDASVLARGAPALPTAGDISPDGTAIAIRTYATVWVWERAPGASVADALRGRPCEAPSALEAQGEAIAFTAGGRGYVTVSEGAGPAVHRFETR